MIEIKDLFLNIKKLLLSEEIRRNLIQETIQELLKIEIKAENIKIKNGVIFLKIKPLYKNEVFLRKEKILNKLEESLGEKKFFDIK